MKNMVRPTPNRWQESLRQIRRRKIRSVPMAIYAEGRTVNPAWLAGAAAPTNAWAGRNSPGTN